MRLNRSAVVAMTSHVAHQHNEAVSALRRLTDVASNRKQYLDGEAAA